MKKIGFVAPWYGEDISGGAEAELRGLVHHLHDAGVELEVLTTCVKDFRSDWNVDHHPAGLALCAGIPVRRFPVRKRDVRAFDAVNAKLMRDQPITAQEEETYQREMVNSPALYRYIRERQGEYSLFVPIGYMFGTTYFGLQACPQKTVMIPCLHDESYAYMDIFKKQFPRVAGMIFHSEPERELAERIYGVRGERFQNLGEGLDTDFTFDAARFRAKYHLDDPFLLYAGRKEPGKKVDELIRFFIDYKRRKPSALKLVLLGGGQIDIPSPEVIDLGFVPVQDKYDAYAAASVFCNPSQFESFSLVVMESWIAGRPVLVNGACAVTRDFVSRTNGGLYYESYLEFAACLDYLLTHREVADQMGRNGRKFVLENFSWPQIVKKYTDHFKAIAGEKE